FLGVEVAELGEGTSNVVDVVGSFDQGSRHLLAMALDLMGEVGLGRGVGAEHPGGVGQSVVLTPGRPTTPVPPQGLSSNILLGTTQLSPDLLDQLLVLGGQHGGGCKSRQWLVTAAAQGPLSTLADTASNLKPPVVIHCSPQMGQGLPWL
uniref:Uncharacterized protein n=1 Tax=Zosterops lateralis melanops TaxID=1220523 RepID=A0A8D2NUS0_ZOSLA